MGLKLGITGMDRPTEAALKAAFEQAQPRLGNLWQLVSEADADHVVVDMDSMYGPMSWIRLHAAGKQVIALTSSPRTQADHLLAQPFDAHSLSRLLQNIANGKGVAATEPASAPGTDAPAPPIAAPAARATPAAPPSAATPAPAPADQLPEELPIAIGEEAAAPPEPAAAVEPVAASKPAAAPAPKSDQVFADWLAPGTLTGRWRYGRDGASVLFDADARVYHGPTALKPLAPVFEGSVRREDLTPIDQAAWSSAIPALGEPQPLVRLQWFGALVAGKGRLLAGHDPDASYRLLKWPQTEREYPKHFRIATAMMKGPATVAEVSAASGVTPEEVADFINANLATGYAEPATAQAAEPAAEPAPKPGGLFGRIRGR